MIIEEVQWEHDLQKRDSLGIREGVSRHLQIDTYIFVKGVALYGQNHFYPHKTGLMVSGLGPINL